MRTTSLLLAAALAVPAIGAAQDLPDIKKTGKLRVLAVMIAEGPQFIAPAGRTERGFDGEILAGFARLQGLAVEIVPVSSWDALAPALTEGKGDLVAGGYTATPARRTVLDFTVEVFPSREVVLNRKPAPPVTKVDDLRRMTVGTVGGTSMADALARLGVKNVDDSIPPGGVPAALRAGKVAAAVDGLEAALVAANQDPALQIGVFVSPPESLAYGVRKGSPALRAALDEYLRNMRRTPTWNRLVVKYFGAAAPDILRRARE